jgi:hypothetical protein
MVTLCKSDSPTLITEVTMSGKILGLVAAAALLASVGLANAKDPVKLTDGQLDKVTAGADVTQIPTIATFLANGNSNSNGRGESNNVTQFSPATAVVVPSLTNVGLGLFNVN